MSNFEFDDYKEFVHRKLTLLPNKGHGQLSKIAQHLNIHTSLVSQVFQGEKNLTFEQACDLSGFFGMTELESDADSAMFFSHWYFAAIKIIISIPGKNKPEAIASELNISLAQVNKTLEFLVSTGQLTYKNGDYFQGPSKIHIGEDSPYVSRHHINWRVKALEKIGNFKEDDFCVTMPANISLKDAKKLRQLLVDTVDRCVNTVDNTKPEALFCLNIDWVKLTS